MTAEAVAVYFEEQGIDINGLDSIAKNYLRYLSQHGATAEERIRQGLGISNRADFTEVDEYLQRLGLVVVRGGRALTPEGRRYLNQPVSVAPSDIEAAVTAKRRRRKLHGILPYLAQNWLRRARQDSGDMR